MEKLTNLMQFQRRIREEEGTDVSVTEGAYHFLVQIDGQKRVQIRLAVPKILSYDRHNLPIPVGAPIEVNDYGLMYMLGMPYHGTVTVATGFLNNAPKNPEPYCQTHFFYTAHPEKARDYLIAIPWAGDDEKPRETGADSTFGKHFRAKWYERQENLLPDLSLPNGVDVWVVPASPELERIRHYLAYIWDKVIADGDKFLTNYQIGLETRREKLLAKLASLTAPFKDLQVIAETDGFVLNTVDADENVIATTYHLYTEEEVRDIAAMTARMHLADALADLEIAKL